MFELNPEMLTLMKKLFFIAVLAVAIVSCKDDDKDSKPNIVGTWLLTGTVYSNCTDSDDNGTETDTDGCADDNCTTITFASNGTFTFSDITDGSEFSGSGTYTQSGSKLSIHTSFGDQDLTIAVTGSVLTATYTEDCKTVESYAKQ